MPSVAKLHEMKEKYECDMRPEKKQSRGLSGTCTPNKIVRRIISNVAPHTNMVSAVIHSGANINSLTGYKSF